MQNVSQESSFAPPRSPIGTHVLRALAERVRAARLSRRSTAAGHHDDAPIGHFGYFRARVRESLRVVAAGFFDEVFAGGEATRGPRRGSPFSPFESTPEEIMADLEWGRA